MKKWSSKWNASKNPSKQRKYVRNAPLHIKTKLLRSPLSKELKTKHDKKTIRVVKGDKVKIVRGQHKGKSGKVERVDTQKSKVYLTGLEISKKDGSKTTYPIHTSNVQITELHLDDKKRLNKIKNVKSTKKTSEKKENKTTNETKKVVKKSKSTEDKK